MEDKKPRTANLCGACTLGINGKCPGVGVVTDEQGFLSRTGDSVARKLERYCIDIKSFRQMICDKNQLTSEDIKKIRDDKNKVNKAVMK